MMPTMRNLLVRESTESNLLPVGSNAQKLSRIGQRNSSKSEYFVRTRSAIVQPATTMAGDQITHDSRTGNRNHMGESPQQAAPLKVNTSFASSFMASLRGRKSRR